MTNAAEQYPVNPDMSPAQGFSVVAGGANPEDMEDNTDIVDKEPLYQFSIDPEKLVGKGALEITDQARTRTVLRTLAETCGEEYEELTEVHTRDRRQQRARNFLAQSVRVAAGTQAKKGEIVDQRAAIEEVRAGLRERQHPVDQILRYVETRFDEELSPGQLKTLERDVLTVTHWTELHAIYNKQIAARKQSS